MGTDGRSLDRALGEHVVIDSTNIPDDVVVQSDIGAGSIDTTELADAAVETAKIADDAVTGAKIDKFKSTEQTGTGSAQSIAHSLGRVPDFVIVYPTELGAGLALDIAEGTHTSVNVVVTVSTGTKYRILAI